ncbi:hypothetical protein ABZ569_10755 [Streptomyces albus]|uniref:hypothetical protein n=1 Tax=Streptomyces albus TaxID=1888 RepID=UPI0033C23D85
MARALADFIRPDAPTRDVTVPFGLWRSAASRFARTSCGGPADGTAQAVHARLHGLPPQDAPLPTALHEQLQATTALDTPEQQAAALAPLAEQLRNAAAGPESSQRRTRWRRLPEQTWAKLKPAAETPRQPASGLDSKRPAFATRTAHANPAAPEPPSAAPSRAATRR